LPPSYFKRGNAPSLKVRGEREVMKLLYNNPCLVKRRKELRRNQTDVEKLLWMKLRNKQILGEKFFRQCSIGPYISDFYCPKKRLAIEIDGSQHLAEESKEYDEERTKYFASYDIKVIRFWNNEVINNMERVIEKIVEELMIQ